MARGAGVHPGTASRALNPATRELVNGETASRVIRVAESLGYRPNPIARSLKTARSATVGLVLPDLTNPLFPPIVRGIEDILGPAGYSAWIVNTDNDPKREESQIQSLRSRQVEGLIVATARLEHPLLEQLHAQGLPMVLVNRRMAGSDIASVTADDATGIANAIRHLVDLGHRRIAHLAGPQDTSTGRVRRSAFQQALRDHGLDDDPALVAQCDYWTESAGARAFRELLDGDARFSAVIAGNDLLALGCYDVITERGLSCPGDISVVGYNDMPFIDKMHPPLTSMRVPHYEVGAESARMLLDTLRDPSRHPRSVLLPVSLVVRRSTDRPGNPSAPRRGRPARGT
ncbi:MAG TPA: LacI family DNA-binding transcriptional regulator [Planosporangium sp.]|nr:LacI family DNA-binding transcriptional regulator [Planosporangium sp.]